MLRRNVCVLSQARILKSSTQWSFIPMIRNFNTSRTLTQTNIETSPFDGNLWKNKFHRRYQIRSELDLLIQDYARKPVPSLSFEFLAEHSMPLTDNDKYILTIKTINCLLTYTCRRLISIQKLPYIAVLNPNIEASNSLYLKTLQSLLYIEYPYGLHNQETMVNLFKRFLDDHRDTLTILSKGLEEISEFYPKEKIFSYLNEHLRDRITMKLIASHYLALIQQNDSQTTNDGMIGILDKSLNISELVRRVSEFVGDLTFVKYDKIIPVKLVEGTDVKFSCIPTNLEYVLTEVIKNSSRAQIEMGEHNPEILEKPIEVAIIRSDEENLNICVKDYGGGIAPDVEAKMFDYSFSTVDEKTNDNGLEACMMPGEDVNTVCGMGFGLPLCRSYLELFDGRLDIQSLWGYGTDVYIKIKGPPKSLLEK